MKSKELYDSLSPKGIFEPKKPKEIRDVRSDFLDHEKKENERKIGMKAGQSLLWFCDELWVFGDVITEGMQAEIQFCKTMNIRIRFIKDSAIQKKLGGKTK